MHDTAPEGPSDGASVQQMATQGPSLLIVTTVSSTLRGFLTPYAFHFRQQGWRVDALAKGATTDPVVREAFDGSHELPLSRSILDVRGIVQGFRATVNVIDAGYDIVHVHTPIAAFVTRAAVRSLPRNKRPAVIYTAHGFHFHEHGRRVTNFLFLTMEKVAGRWTDRLIVINSEDDRAARRYHIVPRQHVVQMPGIGVDTRAYSRDVVSLDDISVLRRSHGFGVDDPLFVIVGELNRNKRPTDVVKAMARMRHREARLLFLGDGPERRQVEGLIRVLGLNERARLAGVVNDVRPAIAAATAVVLASTREGLPRSIMEALSMGVPVISSAARGSRDLVDPDAGLVVRIGDDVALAEAMDWMIEHPHEADTMGNAGRARMVRDYDERLLLAQHEVLYSQLLGERTD